jgi:hypothetical protein
LGLGGGEDLIRLAQVGLDDGGVGIVLQHEPTVGDGDIVVVHVDHARSWGGTLGDLVNVVISGDAGTDVEELADAGPAGQEPHGAAEEGPVGAHHGADIGVQSDGRAGDVSVGLEVVDAAQPVVVDAGDVRLGGVDSLRHPAWLHGHSALHPVCEAHWT